MGTFFIYIIIILFASILQTSTGFGFSIMATPFLLMIFEPMEAIQINIILSLVISCALMRRINRDIDFTALKRFVIGGAMGLPIGIIALLLVDIYQLKLGIGSIILILTILLILKFRIVRTKNRDFIVGGLSGSLTISIGMPGPPLLLYFSGTETQKEKLRATTLAFYLFVYFLSLIIQIIFVGTNKAIWVISGFSLPLVFIGLYIGQLLFKTMNQRVFQKIIYIILLFVGMYMLIESLN